MASEGLLGFIGGVAEGISAEIDRQKKIAADVDEEGRAEARAILAEKRRIAAEKQVADYREKLKRQATEWETQYQTGLIVDNAHPDLLLDEAKNKQIAARIRAGDDPQSLREEYSDLSEAGRIRAGLDAESARLDAGTEAAAERAKTTAREEAKLEVDKERAALGLDTEKKEIKISSSEASTQLKKDLADIHGIDMGRVRDLEKEGLNPLRELASGETTLPEILEDPESVSQLTGQIAIKLHNATSKRLMEAAERGEIKTYDPVTELSNQIAERARITLTALQESLKDAEATGEYERVSQQLYEGLRQGWGEPKEESKQSVAFRQMWNAFKNTYKRVNEG